MEDMTTARIQASSDLAYELGTAMAWYDCEDHVKSTQLRSELLKAPAAQVFSESCHTDYSEELEYAFGQLLIARKKLVGENSLAEDYIAAELSRPKSLLVIDWASSLFDGAVTPETDGFINDDCMPGWDSWLALADVPSSHGKKCLVCWVPRSLSEKVDFGIEVDAASCMSWLNVSENSFWLNGWGTPCKVRCETEESED